jgi:hypothetical protein
VILKRIVRVLALILENAVILVNLRKNVKPLKKMKKNAVTAKMVKMD